MDDLTIEQYRKNLAQAVASVKSPREYRQVCATYLPLLKLTCPPSGTGVHQWLARAAYTLLHFPFDYLSVNEVGELLAEAALFRGRKPKAHEIENAIQLVLGTDAAIGPFKRRPVVVVDKRLEREAAGWQTGDVDSAVEALYGESRIGAPWALPTYEILCSLFPVRTRLSFNHTKYNGDVMRLCPKLERFFARWKVPEWVVPSVPVRRTDRYNHRAIGDFDNWSYQVTEFDTGSLDEQARKIFWMRRRPEALPLRLVCWSGGKSLQAWWDVRNEPEERREAFFRLATSIGADPAHATINQLVRTPNAIRRETHKRQSVIYLL